MTTPRKPRKAAAKKAAAPKPAVSPGLGIENKFRAPKDADQ